MKYSPEKTMLATVALALRYLSLYADNPSGRPMLTPIMKLRKGSLVVFTEKQLTVLVYISAFLD